LHEPSGGHSELQLLMFSGLNFVQWSQTHLLLIVLTNATL
jgi:hypothetical protein